MNKLFAVIAVAVLVLAGCSTGTYSTSNEVQMSVESLAAAVDRANNSKYNESSQYYLTATSDSYTLANSLGSDLETKNEVPISVHSLNTVAPSMLFSGEAIATTDDYYSYFRSVALAPVYYRPVVNAESITYAPGLYKVGADLPAGSYTLNVMDITNSNRGSYSIYSNDSKELIEHSEVFGSKVIMVENGQYLETFNTTITSN